MFSDKAVEKYHILLQNLFFCGAQADSICTYIPYQLLTLKRLSVRSGGENAEVDCCHANTPIPNLLSFMNFRALSVTIVASVSSESFGLREARKWTWSGFV